MYTRFKECLLKPSRITKYVFENKRKTILYFIIILFIHILPIMVTSLSYKEMPSNISNVLVEKFSDAEQINYKICEIDNKVVLTKTTDNVKNQYVNLGYMESTQMQLLLMFNLNETFDINNYQIDDELYEKSLMLLIFEKEQISFSIGMIKKDDSLKDENIKELATNDYSWISLSYERLGIKELDFSVSSSNITTFKNELNKAYEDFYKANRISIYLISIPTIVIFGFISLLMEILFIALIFKLLYRKFNLNYGVFCKIVLCSYTPCVVFNLLSIFYSSLFMYFVGEMLTVIYITIALKNVVITSMGIDLEKILNNKNNNEGDK